MSETLIPKQESGGRVWGIASAIALSLALTAWVCAGILGTEYG